MQTGTLHSNGTTTAISDRLGQLITACRPSFTLPQPFYTEQQIFERDLECIFYRYWLPAGHIARLPEPGSYFLYDIAGESLIITRDRDDRIHALWFAIQFVEVD